MHAELTCQLAQRLVALAGRKRHAHLERRAAPLATAAVLAAFTFLAIVLNLLIG